MSHIKFDLTPNLLSAPIAHSRDDTTGRIGRIEGGNTGKTAPFVRVGIARVALANLSATGVLAAMVAISASDREAAFSCALAAAANFVACAHYHYILRARAQGGWEDGEHDDVPLFSQEMVVDGLRCAASQALIYTEQPAT